VTSVKEQLERLTVQSDAIEASTPDLIRLFKNLYTECTYAYIICIEHTYHLVEMFRRNTYPIL
jgi:hypothetical protein